MKKQPLYKTIQADILSVLARYRHFSPMKKAWGLKTPMICDLVDASSATVRRALDDLAERDVIGKHWRNGDLWWTSQQQHAEDRARATRSKEREEKAQQVGEAIIERLKACGLGDDLPPGWRQGRWPNVYITLGAATVDELLHCWELVGELREWIAKHTQPIDAAVFAEIEDALLAQGRAA